MMVTDQTHSLYQFGVILIPTNMKNGEETNLFIDKDKLDFGCVVFEVLSS